MPRTQNPNLELLQIAVTQLGEMQLSEPRLIAALSNQLKALLTESRFIEASSAHLPPDNISQSRVTSVIEKMKTISQWRKPS